jgi:cytochrome c heme-lyase
MASPSSDSAWPAAASSSDEDTVAAASSSDEDTVDFESMAQVFEYMRLTGTHLDDRELRVIAAGISYRAAWRGIMDFESLPRLGCGCAEAKFVKLLTNQGPTIKSQFLGALGYSTPFDRMDYIVDRCGTHHRYIVEFYQTSETEFKVDARPAFNSGTGWIDRVFRRPFFLGWQRFKDAITTKP